MTGKTWQGLHVDPMLESFLAGLRIVQPTFAELVGSVKVDA